VSGGGHCRTRNPGSQTISIRKIPLPSSPIINARLKALDEAGFEAVANLAATICVASTRKIISIAQIDYMLAGRYAPKICADIWFRRAVVWKYSGWTSKLSVIAAIRSQTIPAR